MCYWRGRSDVRVGEIRPLVRHMPTRKVRALQFKSPIRPYAGMFPIVRAEGKTGRRGNLRSLVCLGDDIHMDETGNRGC